MRVFFLLNAFLFSVSLSYAQDLTQEVVERLNSSDPGIRRGAVWQLTEIKSKAASDAVLSMLAESG
jgi:hypothetical protein